MSEPKTNRYKVKQGRLIFHGGERFTEGMEISLTEAVAEVHENNLEAVLVEEANNPPPGDEPPSTGKRSKSKPETKAEDGNE